MWHLSTPFLAACLLQQLARSNNGSIPIGMVMMVGSAAQEASLFSCQRLLPSACLSLSVREVEGYLFRVMTMTKLYSYSLFILFSNIHEGGRILFGGRSGSWWRKFQHCVCVAIIVILWACQAVSLSWHGWEGEACLFTEKLLFYLCVSVEKEGRRKAGSPRRVACVSCESGGHGRRRRERRREGD